jgi:hypothetical protein
MTTMARKMWMFFLDEEALDDDEASVGFCLALGTAAVWKCEAVNGGEDLWPF